MNSSHDLVRNWLENIFSGESIPSYEVTERSVEALSKLVSLSQEGVRNKKIVMAIQQRQILEYQAETERLNARFQELGLSEALRAGPTDRFLDTLAEVCQTLGIDDPSPTVISLILSQVQIQSAYIPVQDYKKRKAMEELREKKLEFLKSFGQVKSILESSMKGKEQVTEDIAQTRKKLEFMKEKQKEYGRTLQQSEKILIKSGFDKTLKHEHICDLKQKLSKLENELNPLRAKLNGFRALPPDLELAKLKVMEANIELKNLAESLENQIGRLKI